MKLALPPDLTFAIKEQARAAFPRECCGLLIGLRDDEMVRVTALHPARNLASAEDRFEIAPEDHFAALKAARLDGQAVVGCYHSHPNGAATPSATDLAGAGEDGFVWVIAALHSNMAATLASFVYRNGCFTAIGSVTGADLVTSSS